MLFKDIIGHADIKQQLIKGVQCGRVSHAQLFTGPIGNGALPLALAYSQYINCDSPTDTDSCGECPSCRKFTKYIHPDLHFIFPHHSYKSGAYSQEKAEALAKWRKALDENPYFSEEHWYSALEMENKQGIINKDDSADILKALSLKSFEGKYKVMIIWLPERMNDTCANKILKILEEPAEKTLFIMISNNSEGIIKTITSRTQIINVPAPNRNDIEQGLITLQLIDKGKAQEIARISNGNYFKALELAKTDDKNDYMLDHFRDLLRYCWGRKIIEIGEWVETTSSKGREDIKAILNRGIEIFRENMITTVDCSDISFATAYEQEFINKFHVFVTPDNIGEAYQILNDANFDIGRNANVKIVLTDMAFKLATLLFPR